MCVCGGGLHDYKDVQEIFGVNRTGSRKKFSKFVLHRKISGRFSTTTVDALHQDN